MTLLEQYKQLRDSVDWTDAQRRRIGALSMARTFLENQTFTDMDLKAVAEFILGDDERPLPSLHRVAAKDVVPGDVLLVDDVSFLVLGNDLSGSWPVVSLHGREPVALDTQSTHLVIR